ncbi:hypothetical protein DFH07DRAFT_228844 [Mycena maculata]|uniref:PUB domain-containing protein n=1 Tax=Mycena maculata TaxID=230809 RepID=A0AAD7JXB4_9AGAR|nr:hypothetical protein DFH07DRAFT_228844 [Mycena maculata]
MASPPPAPASISGSDLAAAAERRLQQQQGPSASELQFTGPEHDLRQKFRRLIDPGILRPNPEAQALASLKTLLTISENLLREPDNPKFQQFKPTNSLIKRNLIDPKGTVEYCRELGFYPEVKDFQPYYTFNAKKMVNLRIGADMLREAVSLGSEKEVRAAQAKKAEKAVADAAAEKIRLAFEDDRKMKLLRDQLEKERRDARIAAAARRAEQRESMPRETPSEQEGDEDADEDEEDESMPGAGNVLGSGSVRYRSPPSNKKTD